MGKAQIIRGGEENSRVTACAARISTTDGTSLEIYEKRAENPREKDDRLINKVLASGHESVIEHAVFTVAFDDVSVFVEQFIIEFRLASYTVKSRRYVDYSNAGYYIPETLPARTRGAYSTLMDSLFADYARLVEAGVPKEDARFVLPYCFYSNFYCTLNARELEKLIWEMRFGRGSAHEELVNLGEMLTEQLRGAFPPLYEAITAAKRRDYPKSYNGVTEPLPGGDRVELLCAPEGAVELLLNAARLSYPPNTELADVVYSPRARELEFLNYAFIIRGISLSSLTHLARHRLQALIVPPLTRVKRNEHVLPPTIAAEPKLMALYDACFARANAALFTCRALGMPEADSVYFALSGNTIDVITSMNARELMVFFRLRTCERAQWEIREIAKTLLDSLRERTPEIFSLMGPSCLVLGHCPEGRLSCGKPTTR